MLSCQKVLLALESPTKMKGFGSSDIKLFNCTESNISFGLRYKEQIVVITSRPVLTASALILDEMFIGVKAISFLIKIKLPGWLSSPLWNVV